MLEVKNLSVSYGQHQALDGASINVGKGEIVVILGANGAGKSTLLKAICGICEGKVTGSTNLDGIDINGLASHKIVEAGIALVPEGRGIFGDLSVQENLTLGAYSERARDDESGNMDRVFRLFPKLMERRRQVVRTMSGGEQQMVAIGRAMMSNPAILTLDEPSLGLSPLLTKELFESLKAVRSAGIGILLVEQNAKQSLAIADRGYLLENGRIVHEDRAANLINDPAVQAAYLGGGGGKIAPHTVHAPQHSLDTSKQQSGRPDPVGGIMPSPPRPATPSPTDIAKSALQQFSQKTTVLPQTVATPAPQEIAKTHVAGPAPNPSASKATGNGKTGAFGMQIENLVSRAAEQSSTRPRPNATSSQSNVRPATQHLPAIAPLKMPDLTDSRDRLRSILSEIEEAATRARAYRPQDKS
ncbi:MAG: ATP-binding cassette domain-containing protein [Paracoccaceae bacterium]|nr:ATP-binding cassette domain-containing protein [Paracoccaceae bacterium]